MHLQHCTKRNRENKNGKLVSSDVQQRMKTKLNEINTKKNKKKPFLKGSNYQKNRSILIWEFFFLWSWWVIISINTFNSLLPSSSSSFFGCTLEWDSCTRSNIMDINNYNHWRWLNYLITNISNCLSFFLVDWWILSILSLCYRIGYCRKKSE